MPNKRKPRKHKRAGKAVSTKRKTHKKSRRSKVKGGSIKNLKKNPFYINIVNSDDEEGEEGSFHEQQHFDKEQSNDNTEPLDRTRSKDNTEPLDQKRPNDNTEPSLQSKAGMGIGAVALVGGVAALLMLAN